MGPARIASGNLDLYLRLEERRAPEVRKRRQLLRGHVKRMIEGFPNQGQGQRQVTLSETHQGEAWLRIPPRLVGRQERFLRARSVRKLRRRCRRLSL